MKLYDVCPSYRTLKKILTMKEEREKVQVKVKQQLEGRKALIDWNLKTLKIKMHRKQDICVHLRKSYINTTLGNMISKIFSKSQVMN